MQPLLKTCDPAFNVRHGVPAGVSDDVCGHALARICSVHNQLYIRWNHTVLWPYVFEAPHLPATLRAWLVH